MTEATGLARATADVLPTDRLPRIDPSSFKICMGSWVSGVAIVTAAAAGERHGMTLSSFISVSLTPPLVAICANLDSTTYRFIQSAGSFGVNVLSRSQEALSRLFADKRREAERFVGLGTTTAVTGAPLIPDCVANIDCRVVAAHTAGDHVIFVGEVQAIVNRELEPLVYAARSYGEFVPAASKP